MTRRVSASESRVEASTWKAVEAFPETNGRATARNCGVLRCKLPIRSVWERHSPRGSCRVRSYAPDLKGIVLGFQRRFLEGNSPTGLTVSRLFRRGDWGLTVVLRRSQLERWPTIRRDRYRWREYFGNGSVRLSTTGLRPVDIFVIEKIDKKRRIIMIFRMTMMLMTIITTIIIEE